MPGEAKFRPLKKFIQSWLINTLAVLVAVHIVHGIHYEKWLFLLLASLVWADPTPTWGPLRIDTWCALALSLLSLGAALLLARPVTN